MADYNWNTGKLKNKVRQARSVNILSMKVVANSNGGAQGPSLYFGFADIFRDAFLPVIGVCAGAFCVQPRGWGAQLNGSPDLWPFHTSSAPLGDGVSSAGGNRLLGRETASIGPTYSDHTAAPSDTDGAALNPGEVGSSDVRDTCEFMIPSASPWPSNGTGGVVQVGAVGNDAIRRCAYCSIAAIADYEYDGSGRFDWLWAGHGDGPYLPDNGAGTRIGHEEIQALIMRRDIPDPGGAGKYARHQTQLQPQSFAATHSGGGSGITADNASSRVSTGGNWSSTGFSLIPVGTDYTLKKYTWTPASPVHGIGLLTTGADYNQVAAARGAAIIAISTKFANQDFGLRTGTMTRGGFLAESLNAAVHDGSATDPQRVITEALDEHVTAIVMMANDAGAGVSAEDWADDIWAYMERTWTYDADHHFIIVVEWRGDRTQEIMDRIGSYGAEAKARVIADDDERVTIMDLYTPSLAWPDSVFDGGPHLNLDDSGRPYAKAAMERAVFRGGGASRSRSRSRARARSGAEFAA